MIREKRKQLVIAFSDTTAPLKLDILAQQESVPGRTIPLPSEISAGCGMAWKAELNDRETLHLFMEKHSIRWEAIYELDLY